MSGSNILALLTCLLSTSSLAAVASPVVSLNPWTDILPLVELRYPEIPRPALERAFSFLAENPAKVRNQDYLTVIDFDQPSTNERMYVIDLRSADASSYLVAHGKASGENYAERFSNIQDSNMSSLGIYLTGHEYIGQHGVSMTLKGQDHTNSNAENRAIVLHGADYVSYDFIRENGRLGRSWGCPAVSRDLSEALVRRLKDGSVFLIYHSQLELLD